MRKQDWNTYAITGYTHAVAEDRASQGGVHKHQIRVTASGRYQKRIVQSNGRFQASGPPEAVNVTVGEILLSRAREFRGDKVVDAYADSQISELR